jgi:hypothetical protein
LAAAKAAYKEIYTPRVGIGVEVDIGQVDGMANMRASLKGHSGADGTLHFVTAARVCKAAVKLGAGGAGGAVRVTAVTPDTAAHDGMIVGVGQLVVSVSGTGVTGVAHAKQLLVGAGAGGADVVLRRAPPDMPAMGFAMEPPPIVHERADGRRRGQVPDRAD